MSEDPDLHEFVRTTFGITRRSTLAKIRYFDVTTSFPHDIMHDIYEGVLLHEVKLLLGYVTGNSGGKVLANLNEINQRIEDYEYDYPAKKDKPVAISSKVVKQGSKDIIKESG